MREGPNVDLVPKEVYSWTEISDEEYDIVISGQCFEHIEFPWLTIKEIARVLKPSGVCIIIAPNAGREHKAPTDCYRYYADGLSALAKWAELEILHVAVGGVPQIEETEEWTSKWTDATLVAQKRPITEDIPEDPFIYERRWVNGLLVDTYKNNTVILDKISAEFPQAQKYVLFGAGDIGKKWIRILGKEKVHCFVDNSELVVGKEIEDRPVLSYEEFKKIATVYPCIITAKEKNSKVIKEQLVKDGFNGFTLYPSV